MHSWKEIAAHLGRSVRTVQRWEQQEGLPVHRHAHLRRDAVYAYKSELDAWWRERGPSLEAERQEHAPHPVEEAEIPRGLPPRWGWVAAAGGIAILLVAAGLVWRGLRQVSPVPFAARDWALVCDFDNQTGEPLLGESLWTAFTVSLQQSAHVNIIPRARMDAALRRMGEKPDRRVDERVGREICLRENARVFILCSVSKFGQEYGLSARIIEPQQGQTVLSYWERANGQNGVLTALGRITTRMRKDLGESMASIRQSDRPLPLVTTSSLEALRAYAEGGSLWRKRKHKDAVRCFESAVELDPEFAMAHAALASAYLGHVFFEPTKAKYHYDKALQNSSRISDRERLYIQASYHGRLNHVEEAVRLYRLYLAVYPDDIGARQGLGNLLMLNARPEEAVEHFEAILRLAPNSAETYINLASVCRLTGLAEKALEHYAKAFSLEPGWATSGNLNHEYGFGFVQTGNLAKAREVFGLAMAKPETASLALRSLALLDMYEGKYRQAKARLGQAISMSMSEKERLREARNHLFMSLLLEGQGDLSGSVAELDRALTASERLIGEPVWLVARAGIGYARTGALEKGENLVRRAVKLADLENPKDMSELHLLEGQMALSRGDYQRAIEKFRTADKESRSPLTVEALARAFRAAGSIEQAVHYWETVMGMGHLAIGWEAQQPWISAHVDLAAAYLTRGEQAKARQTLDAFAHLWKDADRDLPLIKRAERLRALAAR